jgi:hypothetical protein
MSSSSTTEDTRQLRRERDRLAAETEDDWVRIVLYEDWSHGYLMMTTLMPEAKEVANDLADWMVEAFDAASTKDGSRRVDDPPPPRRVSPKSAPQIQADPSTSETDGTETEGDSPIQFVSRRLSATSATGASRPSFSSLRRHVRQGSDETLTNGNRTSPPVSERTLVEVDAALAADVKGRDMVARPALTPRGVSELKAGTPGSATPTLTETELMKRRRLLDAHIFD